MFTKPKPIEVFYSYSHKDEGLRDELDSHLSILRRQGVITGWYDRRIGAGREWEGEIDTHLNTADIILLLISADFLASDYCYDVEIKRAMERHDAGEAHVIPVILRPVFWKGSPFGKLQALPKDARPVTTWANRDKAFLNVAQGIRAAVEELVGPSASPPPAADAELRPEKVSGLPPIWNVPHHRNPNFTGRESLLAQLRKALTSGQPAALTQAIHGLGGVGKTQLATEYAYRHRADYDLVWWVRAEEPATLAADYAALAAPLNLPEKDHPEQPAVIEAVRHWLGQNTGWLLIFDNAHRLEDVRPYLPRGATGHVIVTSRNPAWRGLANPLTVQVMERPESVAFLLKRTGQGDEAAADALAEEMGDLPLALEQAGAYTSRTGTTFTAYMKLFQSRRTELWGKEHPPLDYPDTVATIWDIAFQQVREASPAGADLLNLCAFLAPDDVPRDLLVGGAEHLPEALAEVAADPLAFGEAIAALRLYSLIEVSGDTWSVHRLVQAAARDRLADDTRRTWAGAAVRLVSGAFPLESYDVRTWPRCARLLPHVLAAAGHAEALEVASEATGRLLNQAGLYLWERAEFAEAKAAFERALTISEATYGPDHPKVATLANNLGSVLKALGDLAGAKAAYERALAISEIAFGPDHPNAAIRFNNLGLVLHDLGDLDGAKAHYERALAIDEATLGPDHPNVARDVNNLGSVLKALGDLAGAKAAYERALAIDQATLGPDHPNVTRDVNNLGLVLRDLGDLAGARAAFERALAIARQIGDRQMEGTGLGGLGNAYRDLGQVEQAIECHQQALEIAREISDRRGEGLALGNLGLAYTAFGRVEQAIECHQQALEIAREIGDRRGEGLALGNLGLAYTAFGRVEQAIECHQQALEIAREIDDRRGEGSAVDSLGDVYYSLGRVEEAIEHYTQALVIAREIGTRFEEGNVLSNLANCYADQGEAQQAIRLYQRALAISRDIGDRRTEQQILNSLGNAYNTLGEIERAMDYYQQALTIARQEKELRRVAEILLSLGSLSRDNEQFDQAKRFWEESRNIYRQLKHPYESTVLSLLYELESTQRGFISLLETAQRFFEAAGFELVPSEEETFFLCQPRDRIWQDKFSQPIPVGIVSGTPLDADTVYALCQSVREALDDKPKAILVVIDHTPTDSGWLQISTMRAEDVQVIPIDDAVLFEGQGRGHQRQVLEKHLRRFLGREQDFYNIRHPVADRLNFFGREALANELIEHLIEGRPVALFGLRKMGKSSLLMYLRDKLPFPTSLVDLQAGVEPGDLYERILTLWSRSMQVKVRDLGWSPPNMIGAPDLSSAFASAARQLLILLEDHDVPPRLCLLVDEMEWIVPHSGKGVGRYLAFARALRGLVQEEEGRFLLLVAGVDPLFNRVNRLAGQQNPFYQFFREVYLPSLERDDCIQMIRNIGRQMDLTYSEEAVAFVANVSGGHPFLARQLCSLALRQLGRSGDVPLPHLQETARRFIREPGTSELVNENGLWGEVSNPNLWPQPQVVENQAILKSLAQTEPQPESDLVRRAQDRRACERSLDELERRAVLGKLERSLFNIRLCLFRNWIRRYQLGEEI